MIKLQDFAKQQGVTDRAIQKHLKTYAEEFAGLIERRGQNGTWLTEEACELLRSKMKSNPTVVFDQDQSEYKKEVSELKMTIKEQADRIERKDVIIDRLQERLDLKDQKLLEAETSLKQIESNQKEKDDQLQQSAEKIEELSKINSELETKIASLPRIIRWIFKI